MLTISKEKFVDLTIKQGNSHNFLGTSLTITKDKRVEIYMRKKTEEVVGMFGE